MEQGNILEKRKRATFFGCLWNPLMCSKDFKLRSLMCIYETICFVLQAHCDVQSKQRAPCGRTWSSVTAKYECLSRGCCFEEALDGKTTCYRVSNAGKK